MVGHSATRPQTDEENGEGEAAPDLMDEFDQADGEIEAELALEIADAEGQSAEESNDDER